jgi:hypothetical protein
MFQQARKDLECQPLPAQAGRSPSHGGSASHSADLIRRSSPPTLMKTNGASSYPVLEPANIAGVPYASRMVDLIDMSFLDL